jgi:hypothetical protein
MTEYYPEVLKLSDFRKTALGAEFLVDEDEEHRVQELEDKKARGKGAPTKAKQKGQSVALSRLGCFSCSHPYHSQESLVVRVANGDRDSVDLLDIAYVLYHVPSNCIALQPHHSITRGIQ